MTNMINLVFWGGLFLIVVIKFVQSIRLVPTKKAYIVERLGKYHKHFLLDSMRSFHL